MILKRDFLNFLFFPSCLSVRKHLSGSSLWMGTYMGGGDDVMMNLRKAHDSPLGDGWYFHYSGLFPKFKHCVFPLDSSSFFFLNSSWSVFIGSCVACAEKIWDFSLFIRAILGAKPGSVLKGRGGSVLALPQPAIGGATRPIETLQNLHYRLINVSSGKLNHLFNDCWSRRGKIYCVPIQLKLVPFNWKGF